MCVCVCVFVWRGMLVRLHAWREVSGGAPPQCNLTHSAVVLFLEALSRKLSVLWKHIVDHKS